MNIVRTYRDQKWLDVNLPILEQFWKEVEHYREVGIETHPKFPKKKIKLDLTTTDESEENENENENVSLNEYIIRE